MFAIFSTLVANGTRTETGSRRGVNGTRHRQASTSNVAVHDRSIQAVIVLPTERPGVEDRSEDQRPNGLDGP